jgi:DNA end-binding protein Ku
MARALWKGAIAFGLVNIPVELYSGSRDSRLDLDWIDKRDMAPVGYQRINKETGKPVPKEEIVKGYKYSDGRYVILSDADFEAANPKATQTIDIVAFVDAGSIPPPYFETPYRLAPAKRGEKPYALLREALRDTKKIGIAQVVIRARQHLAALMVEGDMLLLETLRYEEEILDPGELSLPAGGKRAGISEKELELAERLVDDMADEWDPGKFKDTYRHDLLALVEKKVKAGETEVVTKAPRERKEKGAQVIDLMAALKRSLDEAPARRKPPARAKTVPAKTTRAERSHARKRA